jgi:hypothetical protein
MLCLEEISREISRSSPLFESKINFVNECGFNYNYGPPIPSIPLQAKTEIKEKSSTLTPSTSHSQNPSILLPILDNCSHPRLKS